MKKDNVIQQKSYAFALRAVRVYQYLVKDKKEYVLCKQLLRSGTSIGANVEEAIGAQSEKDFYSKLTVAYKEARESHYWIRNHENYWIYPKNNERKTKSELITNL